MSNTLAIAAVTAAFRELLRRGLAAEAAVEPTTLPLELAKKTNESASEGGVNLFLYNTQYNAALRNSDQSWQNRPGETGSALLPLDLFYLVTAYEPEDKAKDVLAHRLLGRAMLTVHDHPLLGAAEIEAALAGTGLQNQIERIRITPHPLSVEELSKLWVIFQTEYRPSVAYQVSVVLIDSNRPARAPLPVLRRGEQDQGPTAEASPPPLLFAVRPKIDPPNLQPGARLGGNLLVSGNNLPIAHAQVRFTRQPLPAFPHLPETILLPPLISSTNEEVGVTIPNNPAAMSQWVPGFYTVSLLISAPNQPTWATNEVPLALLPTITVSPTAAAPGDLSITITCTPRLRAGQQVLLLFSDRQVSHTSLTNPADTTLPTVLLFNLKAVPKGRYVVRLRVNGVDSFPVVLSGKPPLPVFDPSQTVVIS